MRRSQWFVFSVVFLLIAIFFQIQGNKASYISESMSEDNIRELINKQEEKTWTEAFGIYYLGNQDSANTLFIVSQLHLAFSNLCWAFFIACMIGGWIEHKSEKKKK